MNTALSFLSGLPGGGEVLLLFVAILVFFGTKKLPGIARSIGRALEQLRSASDEFKDQLMNIDEEPRPVPQDMVDISEPNDSDADSEKTLLEQGESRDAE